MKIKNNPLDFASFSIKNVDAEFEEFEEVGEYDVIFLSWTSLVEWYEAWYWEYICFFESDGIILLSIVLLFFYVRHLFICISTF